MTDVFFNGVFLGTVDKPMDFVNAIKGKRRKNELNSLMNVYFDEQYDMIEVTTEKGRSRRPVIIAKAGKSLLTKEVLHSLDKGEMKWDDLVKQGIIEYVD